MDDALDAGQSVWLGESVKKSLDEHFETRELKEARYFVGIHIFRNRAKKEICIPQRRYIDTVIENFGMPEAHRAESPMSNGLDFNTKIDGEREKDLPYRELVGCVMYAALKTRPDISYAVGRCRK